MTGTTNLTLWLGQDQYAEANNDLTGMITLIEEANQIAKEWKATDPEMGDRNMPTVAGKRRVAGPSSRFMAP